MSLIFEIQEHQNDAPIAKAILAIDKLGEDLTTDNIAQRWLQFTDANSKKQVIHLIEDEHLNRGGDTAQAISAFRTLDTGTMVQPKQHRHRVFQRVLTH